MYMKIQKPHLRDYIATELWNNKLILQKPYTKSYISLKPSAIFFTEFVIPLDSSVFRHVQTSLNWKKLLFSWFVISKICYNTESEGCALRFLWKKKNDNLELIQIGHPFAFIRKAKWTYWFDFLIIMSYMTS